MPSKPIVVCSRHQDPARPAWPSGLAPRPRLRRWEGPGFDSWNSNPGLNRRERTYARSRRSTAADSTVTVSHCLPQPAFLKQNAVVGPFQFGALPNYRVFVFFCEIPGKSLSSSSLLYFFKMIDSLHKYYVYPQIGTMKVDEFWLFEVLVCVIIRVLARHGPGRRFSLFVVTG